MTVAHTHAFVGSGSPSGPRRSGSARPADAADLLARLRAGGPVLWDGAVGTALIAQGLDLASAAPESWLHARPEAVQAVHAGFAASGCDVVQTNSFGLLRLLLRGGPGRAGAGGPAARDLDARDVAARALDAQALDAHRALARRSVELAQAGAAAVASAPLVVATLGPPGPFDPGQAGALEDAVAALAQEFAAAGAAALHLETFYEPAALRAAVAGVHAANTRLPLFVSVTLSVGQSGLETPLGTPLSRMLRELERTPPEAIGVNCGLTARRMRKAVQALREWAGARIPVLAQPQVGQTGPDCKRPAVPESPERFAEDALVLLADGADAVGGCCGATAAHLRAVRTALDLGQRPGQGQSV